MDYRPQEPYITDHLRQQQRARVQGTVTYTEIYTHAKYGTYRQDKPERISVQPPPVRLPLFTNGNEAPAGYMDVLKVDRDGIQVTGEMDTHRHGIHPAGYTLRACLLHPPKYDRKEVHWIYPLFGIELVDNEETA